MREDCPMCQMWRSKGARFCSSCGKNLTSSEDTGKHPFLHLMTQLAVLAVVFVILMNTAYCIANFDAITDECSTMNFHLLIPFGIWDLDLFSISGNGVAFLLAVVLVTEIICLAYAVYKYLFKLREETERHNEVTEMTGLGCASAGLCVSLFLAIAYFLVMGLAGHTADTSWMDDYTDNQMVMMLTRAGVREELMYRLVWIGLPMAVVALAYRKDSRCWYYLFGGFGMSKLAVLFILVSSILFGLAHYDGWGWTKVGDAALSGIIFGYIYTQYGLYASILAHTANDTITTISYAGLGQGTTILVEFGMIGLGFLILIYWFIKPNLSSIDVRKMKNIPEKIEVPAIEKLQHR